MESQPLSNRMVCEKHFTRDCFTNDNRNRITAAAIPTILSLDDEELAIAVQVREDGQIDIASADRRTQTTESSHCHIVVPSPSSSTKNNQRLKMTPPCKNIEVSR